METKNKFITGEMELFSIKGEEVSRTMRDEPPTHFELKIKSFSSLSKSSLERYESGNFEAGGYKWKLCLHPKGNKDKNGEGHISLYLVISDTNSLSRGWEVHALFRLFLLDQLEDKYLSIQDSNGRARRFRASRTQSGFDRLISLKQFNDPSNGYLVNDTCVFGAEVFVHRESVSGKGECLLMTAGPDTCNHTWKIENFSALFAESLFSEVFTAGGHKWRVNLWPKGHGEQKGKSLSLFLELNDYSTLLPGQGVYVEAQLRVLDQVNGKHMEKKMQHWFYDSSKDWGWAMFLSLNSLKNQSMGYLVKGGCIIETHLLFIGAIEKLGQKSE
ncbi:protein RESTRICTED TEV MOVEMENT 3-like isoform X2 [Macadamia integrifolia]|uniref:protein RESTRICTED TEV MOVEMENT 3-like isoform X2 n=1 Tax=Macadamia integrifolia TaxID=60698 RepID=UPI001C4F7EE5|nr:protein RESTRICTED TEV MOVEMENT 3-like isoform X2 [Macadamia integrifolia]XP_042508640.1 protein RESTRICTED TEV MOVEMENT 3-like isoform X2 [Macadamia integrifolia]XP_042508641.1 protein RESTRICTED TEV MOVEMENT 3-like isoform X2 [Macadamia integrifolia]